MNRNMGIKKIKFLIARDGFESVANKTLKQLDYILKKENPMSDIK